MASAAAIGDIKPGDFVGIASLPKADGGDGALEVLIFPPAMKGTGEGSYGWDLKPNSSMTNATVANAVKGIDGHTLTVAYHGKEKKIAIPVGTPVVTLAPAGLKDLAAGAVVFVPAVQGDKGALMAQQVLRRAVHRAIERQLRQALIGRAPDQDGHVRHRRHVSNIPHSPGPGPAPSRRSPPRG